jgi:hypothetical protein
VVLRDSQVICQFIILLHAGLYCCICVLNNCKCAFYAGLRFPEQTSHQVYRARSAPHRQRLAVSYDNDARSSPIKVLTSF